MEKKGVGELLLEMEIDALEDLQAALDAAVVWFNAVETGCFGEIRPDVARVAFYEAAKKAGLPVL